MNVQIKGIKELLSGLKKFPLTFRKEIADAEDAISEVVLADRGGGHPAYPKETKANRPPVPYYVRYQGTQRKSGNDGRSEKMGEQFSVKTKVTKNYVQTSIKNKASYAPYPLGDLQPAHMAAKGWRKLADLANKNIKKVVKLYNEAVERAIRKSRLK